MFANRPLLCCQGLEEPISVFTKVVNDAEQWAKQRRQQLLVELRAMDQLSYAERRSQLRALQLELHPDKQENLDFGLFDCSDWLRGGSRSGVVFFFGGGETYIFLEVVLKHEWGFPETISCHWPQPPQKPASRELIAFKGCQDIDISARLYNLQI